jgi:hypothetical protein
VSIPQFEDTPPQTERVSDYDERHFVTYLRILEAGKENASWQEVAAVVFGLNVAADPGRAKRVYDSHLARAKWMSEAGYLQLKAP